MLWDLLSAPSCISAASRARGRRQVRAKGVQGGQDTPRWFWCFCGATQILRDLCSQSLKFTLNCTALCHPTQGWHCPRSSIPRKWDRQARAVRHSPTCISACAPQSQRGWHSICLPFIINECHKQLSFRKELSASIS